MKPERVTFYPCGGVGLVASSVCRLCALHLSEDLLPGRVDLLDMHQLLVGKEEEKRLVTRQPVIVMDGCAEQCGSNFLWLLGIKPALRFYLPGFAGVYRLKLGGRRAVLVETGQQLARLIAGNAARMARIILGGEYDFTPQTLKTEPVQVADYSVRVPDALEYLEVIEPCIHRPETMPALPGEDVLRLEPTPEHQQ